VSADSISGPPPPVTKAATKPFFTIEIIGAIAGGGGVLLIGFGICLYFVICRSRNSRYGEEDEDMQEFDGINPLAKPSRANPMVHKDEDDDDDDDNEEDNKDEKIPVKKVVKKVVAVKKKAVVDDDDDDDE
jgi:hypothetical protein